MVLLSCETDFVSRNDEFKALARDIAMHVAASDPQYIKSEDVSEADKKNAEAVMKKEIEESPANAGKPEEMKSKILEGKMSSYFKDKVLMEQPFIKNPDVTIGNLIESAIQKFGEKTEISKFVRFSL
jgi:elongation factor Ts